MVIDSSVPVALLLFNEGNILLSGHMSGIHTGYTSHPVSLTHSLNPLVFSTLRGASSEDCNESGVFVPPCIFRWGLQNPHRKVCRPTSTQTLAILMQNEKCIWKKDCFWSLSCSSTALDNVLVAFFGTPQFAHTQTISVFFVFVFAFCSINVITCRFPLSKAYQKDHNKRF